MSAALSDAELIKATQDAYGAVALTAGPDDVDRKQPKICILSGLIDTLILDTAKVAASFGYTAAELLAIPTEANLGLSCGNPVGAATLKEVIELLI